MIRVRPAAKAGRDLNNVRLVWLWPSVPAAAHLPIACTSPRALNIVNLSNPSSRWAVLLANLAKEGSKRWCE